jgi:hypothetical protein
MSVAIGLTSWFNYKYRLIAQRWHAHLGVAIAFFGTFPLRTHCAFCLPESPTPLLCAALLLLRLIGSTAVTITHQSSTCLADWSSFHPPSAVLVRAPSLPLF